MENYWNIIVEAYSGYADWLWKQVIHPDWNNFFDWVIALSAFFFLLEIIKPWRKDQPLFRKDFWLDLFYIFFNFFIFSLIFWKAAQEVLVTAFNDFLGLFGLENAVMLQMDQLPVWAYYLILFVVGDFISWWVHRLLHFVPFMWKWHKVHHSVEEMGFAAHVRYHWMENVVYWTFRFIPLTMLGADLVDIFGIHVFNVAWGHFNHANITVNPRISGGVLGALIGLGLASLYLDGLWMGVGLVAGSAAVGALVLGPFMRYIFNSPEMHIWHHVSELPRNHPDGINFGITLAIWDYIFGTAHVPFSGRDIELGFPGLAKFPHSFLGQLIYGFGKDKDS
ncbi:MAG: sterol desaturase family protein [Bacteroidia bacterium]|nr:sterol desaturase family protein [Bacteroidia bacterium]